MVNKQPNQSGLRQNNKKNKPSKRKQKKLDDQVQAKKKAQEKIDKVRADPNKFIDTYLIKLGERFPNDIQTAKQLLKWKELKDKENIDEFLNMEY